MEFNDLVERAMVQVGKDFGCPASDFRKPSNTMVRQVLHPERRMFIKGKDFFRAACFGWGTVAVCHGDLEEWCGDFLHGIEGIRAFDSKGFFLINQELGKHGMRLGYMNDFYLPDPGAVPGTDPRLDIKWYDAGNVNLLYADDRFHNALMYTLDGLRNDVLVVVAMDGESIMGMAGASDDAPGFWQVGIDVVPGYRGRGVATGLVAALTRRILDMGHVSYYGTWLSNTQSRRTALASGYKPAWTEVSAVAIQDGRPVDTAM